MKIGILLKELNCLANWELRILQEIIDTPDLEISLLITSDEIGKQKSKSEVKKPTSSFAPKNIFSKILFKTQWRIEREIVGKEEFTVDKNSISKHLNKVVSINANTVRKGSYDLYNKEDSDHIKNYDLDVIIALGNQKIKGEILNSSRKGIWSLRHGDEHICEENPVGFWEIVRKEPYVVVTLNQLTEEVDKRNEIDKTYFNRHWSLVKTNDMVLESSVALLMKNLKKLLQDDLPLVKISAVPTPTFKVPNLLNLIGYFFSFHKQLLTKVIERTATKLFGIRYYCFTLFIARGDFLNTTLSSLKPIELPKDEFWADPFLFNYNNERYVFFENYPYKTKRGKLSCGKIKNNEIIDVVDVLDFEYHLSYPYIFEENNEIYLMPETGDNKRLEIYKCLKFPDKWELFSTAFDGEMVVDAFFYDDESDQKWLFLNKASASTVPLENELYIYKVDSVALNEIEPHRQNPVIIDSRIARNAGAIFTFENELYRPSQSNVDALYGKALNINKIEKLTIDEYVEKTVKTVQPDFHKGLLATHHLHQSDGLFVIDAAYKKL